MWSFLNGVWSWLCGAEGPSEPPGASHDPSRVELPFEPTSVDPGGSQASLYASMVKIMLDANHAYTYDGTDRHPFIMQGGALHKLDDGTALQIAEVIVDNATGGLTVPYLMACLRIESVFDPECENGNYSYLNHVGSNPHETEDGFDVGIAQLKLKYLMEDRKLSVEDAHTFATDYRKAIPYMATTMKLLLGYADAMIQDVPHRSDLPPALLNRYVYATGAYNFGRTGMKNLVKTTTTIPNHCKIVMQYEEEIAKALNLPSLFTEVDK